MKATLAGEGRKGMLLMGNDPNLKIRIGDREVSGDRIVWPDGQPGSSLDGCIFLATVDKARREHGLYETPRLTVQELAADLGIPADETNFGRLRTVLYRLRDGREVTHDDDDRWRVADQIEAGMACMRVIENNPKARAALHRAQARMRTFAEAPKDPEFQREHERARREREQAFGTLGEAIQAADHAAQQDLAGLGFTPPKRLEDWEHLARVVEIPFETIRAGNFTARDVYLMALAWIERQQTRERVTQPPSRGATSLKDGHRAASVKLSAAEGLVLRILHALESGELRNRLPHIILGPAAPPCTSFVWAIANAIDARCLTEAAIPGLEKMG